MKLATAEALASFGGVRTAGASGSLPVVAMFCRARVANSAEVNCRLQNGACRSRSHNFQTPLPLLKPSERFLLSGGIILEFFRAHRAIGTSVPTYLIESTAPNNVDDTAKLTSESPPELAPIDSDLAVKQIAEALVTGAEPNLVVMVHGTNNPQRSVLAMYTRAATTIQRDAAIASRRGLVCVGYRWPSENIGEPLPGTWSALPALSIRMLCFGIGVMIFSLSLFYVAFRTKQSWLDSLHLVWISSAFHVVTMLGWTMAGLVFTAALLRVMVYFRDNYRASNYGIPDLIQLIRAIDAEIVREHARRGASRPPRNVQLSFVGHSMGAFVVTNAIRTLSDVFATPVEGLNSYGAGGPGSKPALPSSAIGNVFCLKRLVLISPDIPAEALLSSRGNFLASTLSRFDEAFLFSNEGDEVLRQMSTVANYFVFPTNTRDHGFRLGNVEILSRNFGLIDVGADDFLRVLRIGNKTLQELYDSLEEARALRQASSRPATQAPLPRVFTYFDCTDYIDEDWTKSPPRPILTFSKWRKRYDADARLPFYSHLFLLLCYLLNNKRPNVHNGYFEGLLSQQLMYRLGCLGYDETIRAYGGEPAMGTVCERKRIRVLVSPNLHTVRTGPVPPPAAAATMEPHAQPVPLAQLQTIDMTVPNLVGMSIVEARATVAAVRALQIGQASVAARGTEPQLLLMEIARERSDLPAGTILSQTPEPGSQLQQRTSIEVAVAR
jgi:pimeloyl-ACP methyl ester carboxylesterase